LHGWKPAVRLKFNQDYVPEGLDFDKCGDIIYMVRDPNGLAGLVDIPPIIEGGYKSIKEKFKW
jgi:hypothetical protein